MKRFMHLTLTRKVVVLIAILALLAVPLVALADTLNLNDLVTGGDVTKAPGSTGSASAYLDVTNGTPVGDPNGCDATGAAPAIVTLTSSDTSKVTIASPGYITLTGCGASTAQTLGYTVSATASAGTVTVSGHVTGGKLNQTNQYQDDSFIITISSPAPSDTTAPTTIISLGPLSPNGSHNWYVTDVHVTVSATDNVGGSGVSETRCVLDPAVTPVTFDDLPALCAYTDPGADVTTEGLHTFYAASKDVSGNKETPIQSTSFKIDKTGPSALLSVTAGTAGANGWYTSDVTVHTSGSDAISDNVICTPDQFQTTETTGQDFNGSCTNDAGLTTNAAQLTVKLDKTGPSAGLSVTAGTPGANGWYTSDVTVHTDGTDSISGVSCTADQHQTDETAGTDFNGSCTNGAGLTTDATTLAVKLDKTGPTATLSAVGTLGNNNWYVSDVTIKTIGSDTISDPTTCTADQSLIADTMGQTFNGSCTNDAGLTTNATPLTIKRDATPPALNISGVASGNYGICSGSPSEPTFAPTDATSGIAGQSDSWTTPSNPSGVGTYTYYATATDAAGNKAQETRTYHVTYSGAFSGYLQPINTDGSSRFKLGSTIPVKFQMMCGTTPIANAIAKLYIAKGDSVPDPGVDEAISTAASTTGNLFRYDGTAQQYIFNLSTKLGYTNPGSSTPISFSTGTWTLKILLDDGTWQSVNIQLPK